MLWTTRGSSGFPWPFQHRSARWLLLGHPSWSAVPVWRQVLGIPLRPWRYARMVRNIARVRNRPYSPSRQDDVP